MDITDGENNLTDLREDYHQKLTYLVSLDKTSVTKDELQMAFNNCHYCAVRYFNYFERTVDEYRPGALTSDSVIRKPEDALHIVTPICNHWSVLRKLANEKELIFANPDEASYASIQRVIKTFYPERKDEFRTKFIDAGLPVYGFDQKEKHSRWKMKKNYENYIVSFALIAVSLLLIFTIRPTTDLQNNALRLTLCFSFAFAAVFLLRGSVLTKISIGNAITISAAGGIGVFIFLYMVDPPGHKDIAPLQKATSPITSPVQTDSLDTIKSE